MVRRTARRAPPRSARSVLLPALTALALLPASPAAAQDLAVREQWKWDGALDPHDRPFPDGSPIVVQLTDDDGDGRVTTADVPDVAFLHWQLGGTESAALTVLDGATGLEHFTIQDRPIPAPVVVRGTLLAAADLDGDGVVELAVSERERVNVYDAAGNWLRSVAWPSALSGPAGLGIADLDLDGVPDFFVNDMAASSDGAWSWRGGFGDRDGISHAVDLDPASPGLELLVGNCLYSSTGALLWRSLDAPWGTPAVADLDADLDPEVLIVAGSSVHVLDRLGAAVAPPFDLGREGRGPVVADLDADGRPELALSIGTDLIALDWDGAALVESWRRPVNDASCCAEPTAYDLTGDGAAEVIFSDQANWVVACGLDGSLLHEEGFVSSTAYEQPIVADCDGDGLTEVLVLGLQSLVPSDANLNSFVAYEVPSAPPARAIWNQHPYHVTNVEDDGSVPSPEPPPWTLGAGWEVQAPVGDPLPPEPFDLGQVSDLSPCARALQLDWESIERATYTVHRSFGAGADCASALASPPVATDLAEANWIDRDTVPGEDHFYAVRAVGGARLDCDEQVLCLGPARDEGTLLPDGVYATLFASHDGDRLTMSWTTARPIFPDEHFHLLKALDAPTELFSRANPEGDLSRSHSETDLSSPLQFFDLRVANPCEEESLDEYPPG